ncbi:MAG: hypothetical protein ACI9XC_001959 [Gammaproteobacteria bacterium]|jgi:hypothetical protein
MKNFCITLIGIIIYTLSTQLAYAHGMSEAEIQAIIEGGNLSYIKIGATHMLTGFDHLLFVFGIIFFLRTYLDIIKYVTAFTLGHSATLIIATLISIQLNYFIIDAVIGLSVSYIAFANIDGFRKYLNINPPNMMVMIVSLGLIHGLGLSTRLQELPLSEDGLLLNIISFNVGIELGQIFALVLMLLVMVVWRKSKSFASLSIASNYLLIIAGGFLFLMQMHGYAHVSNPNEFAVAPTNIPEILEENVTLPSNDNVVQEAEQREDLITITVPARGSIEYKFYLKEGAYFEYAWDTNGVSIFYDFHGEPDGDTTGYFESFEKNMTSQASGSLTAPFEGIHGWYWKNGTALPVNVVLMAKGEYQLLNIN